MYLNYFISREAPGAPGASDGKFIAFEHDAHMVNKCVGLSVLDTSSCVTWMLSK